MRRGIFITGTDTGIGKTLVAAGVLQAARSRGLDAVPMKPVQTGAVQSGENLVAQDLDLCLRVGGIDPDSYELELMCPYRYEPACSPHLAGRLAGRYPSIDHILLAADELSASHDAVIVEGAGGALVPLDEHDTMLDLMRRMGLPVLLVARAALGTINHTLLTLAALKASGVPVLGVVLNETEYSPSDMIREDNPKAIEQFGGVSVLGELRYFVDIAENLSAPETWKAFEADLTGLDAILEVLTP